MPSTSGARERARASSSWRSSSSHPSDEERAREKSNLVLKAEELRAAGDEARARGLTARAAEVATALLANADSRERDAYSELAVDAVGLWLSAGHRERGEVLALNLLQRREVLTAAAARAIEGLLAGRPAPARRAAARTKASGDMSVGTATRAVSRPPPRRVRSGDAEAAEGARGGSRRSRRRA